MTDFKSDRYCICSVVVSGDATFTTQNAGDLWRNTKTWLSASPDHKLDKDYNNSDALLSAVYGETCERHKCLNKNPILTSSRASRGGGVPSTLPTVGASKSGGGAFFSPSPLPPPPFGGASSLGEAQGAPTRTPLAPILWSTRASPAPRLWRFPVALKQPSASPFATPRFARGLKGGRPPAPALRATFLAPTWPRGRFQMHRPTRPPWPAWWIPLGRRPGATPWTGERAAQRSF